MAMRPNFGAALAQDGPQRRASGSVGRSRRGLLSAGIVVVGKAGIQALEEVPKRTIESARSRLQQQMRPARGPLHLLTLGKAFADHSVHR